MGGCVALKTFSPAAGRAPGAPLACVGLFPSRSPGIGKNGQATAAAANAFRDTLAHARRAAGRAALSINWGPWSEVGMAADPALASQLAGLGVEMLSPEKGIAVLENLLTNAVKYSPAGKGITLSARVNKVGWEVCVKDQGIGMSEEQLERIFDKFYRADNSNTAVSGLGLGMNIVKQIIEGHGGTIRVESRVGRGTTVIFDLPFATE